MANGKHSRLGTLTNMLHKARAKNRKMQAIGERKILAKINLRINELTFWGRFRFVIGVKFLDKLIY